MIFHTVSAFKDLIRREENLIDQNYLNKWNNEISYLSNSYTEKYKYITGRIISRLPVLTKSTPRDLEVEEINNMNMSGYLSQKLNDEELLRLIRKKRFEYRLKKAKKLHSIAMKEISVITNT